MTRNYRFEIDEYGRPVPVEAGSKSWVGWLALLAIIAMFIAFNFDSLIALVP